MLRRTKIVATLGPATDTPESLAAIIKAGLAGLAYSLLMPYLDRLQDTFLTPRLEAAIESGEAGNSLPPSYEGTRYAVITPVLTGGWVLVG